MKRSLLFPVTVFCALGVHAGGNVVFVECPKCEKRIRIQEDGVKAFVNLSRIDAPERERMKARAERLLRLAEPVEPADPLTPLMGWSSWNTFALDISEELILDVAKAMATNGLKAAGYVYVNLDDGFYHGHDKDGNLIFHPKRFPNGMKGTVDGIHALGMKAGTYSDAGIDTCGSNFNGDKGGIGSGLYGHDEADCRLHFKELGFDFFKVDYCGGRALKLEEQKRFREIAAAILATGRSDVRLNICRWAFPGVWASEIAGSWRTTRDIRASWKSIRDIIAENLYLSAYVSPGHFNDLDMLEVGHYKGKTKSAFVGHGDTGLTVDEETAHFGMWCIMSSPLVLGCDVRKIPETTLKLVTNPFLLRMNQNRLGLQAIVVSRSGEAYVLAKDAFERFGASRYVALYNASDSEREIRVDARALDLDGRIDVFDLVERADTGSFTGSSTVVLPPHSAKFYLFDAERRLERRVYEAESAYLTYYSELDGTSYGSEESCRKQGRAYFTSRDGASGGVAVVNLGGREINDLVWKDVRMDAPGKRRVVFRCSSPETRTFFCEVGGVKTELAAPPTNGAFAEVVCELDFAAGVQSVRLFNPSSPMPDVDSMEIR